MSYSTNTGSSVYNQDVTKDSKIVNYPIDKYDIKVRVGNDGEFIGIEEISINKSFVNYKQQTSNKGYHDVSEFYAE